MPEAKTLLDLLQIRQAHQSKLGTLNKGYGTALGRKNLNGPPAVLVFVERKIHERWLSCDEKVPATLEDTNGGLTCPTDVIPVGGDLARPYLPGRQYGERLKLREGLRGAHKQLSPGSQLGFQQVSGQLGLGTLAAFARCRCTKRLGLLTNAHIGTAVGTVLTHPDPESPIIATVVRRLESLPLQERFPGLSSTENSQYVLDCAFAELSHTIDPKTDIQFGVPWVTAEPEPIEIRWAPIGAPLPLDLSDLHLKPIGDEVFAVGRTLSDQIGVIRAFAYEHADGPHISGYTDFLIGSKEDNSYFSQPGDSGKLIFTNNAHLQPVALLWGGGLLRTDVQYELADHSFAVDINIILDKLNIDIARKLDE